MSINWSILKIGKKQKQKEWKEQHERKKKQKVERNGKEKKKRQKKGGTNMFPEI